MKVSVEVQVNENEVLKTERLSRAYNADFPVLSTRCEWPGSRFCVATQTPSTSKGSSWHRQRMSKKPKAPPPLVDPVTGKEINRDLPSQCVGEKKSVWEMIEFGPMEMSDVDNSEQSISRDPCPNSSGNRGVPYCRQEKYPVAFREVGTQIVQEELMRTDKIERKNYLIETCPPSSYWCKWPDGRMCVTTQTAKRMRYRPGRPWKGSPPIVDPYALQVPSVNCGESWTSTEIKGDFIWGTNKKSKGVQVVLADLKRTFKISYDKSNPGRKLTTWCKWPDGRMCSSSQTPKKRSRRKPRRPNNMIIPPLVDPLTDLVINSGSDAVKDGKISFQGTEFHKDEDNFNMDECPYEDLSDDSGKLCIMESEEMGVQANLEMNHRRRRSSQMSSEEKVATWMIWDGRRECRSSQTIINPRAWRRRERLEQLKGRPPPVPTNFSYSGHVSSNIFELNASSNGDDKSDDENPVSDDEQVKTEAEDEPQSADLSDDEKQEDDDKPSGQSQLSDDENLNNYEDEEKNSQINRLSDDEKQEEEDKVAQRGNQLSDDEKQDDEEKENNNAEPQEINEETKLSDDEILDEDKGQAAENTQQEDKKDGDTKEDDVEDSLKTKDEEEESEKGEPREETKMETEDQPEAEDSDQVDMNNDISDSGKDDDPDSSELKGTDDKSDETSDDKDKCKEGETPGKKLRPRIRAPSEDGNSTRTPVLKKDIKLPAPTKGRQEEFIVPEQESDIYDKEKFIVKDDTATDDQDDSMDFEVDMGNMDNEDSINLTIGEDDAKFMTEEAGLESEDQDALETRGAADRKKGNEGHQSGNKQQTSSESDESRKAKSLWVSGLSSATRATDLKHMFSKHGKVMAAKIVTNAKTPGARCYGFVTMTTPEDATACIKALNLTELHGRLISVEPVADKPASKKIDEKKKSPSRVDRDRDRDRASVRSNSTKREHSQNGERRHERLSGSRRTSRERDRGGRRYHQEMLSFDQIKAERKKQKALAVDREMREINRKKRDEISRQRDVERRNREEALRLEREREKLKYERERIERERAELLLLERARLEREKEELKRQKLRLEEDRILKRSLSDRDEFSRSKRHSPDYGGRHFSSSSHHRSPGRHYDRYGDRSLGSSKRDERKEHRSRSPRRRSRDRPTSSKSSGKVLESTEDSSGRKCYYCGLPSHARRKCPAMDVPCPICGKPGHFGSMCSVLGYKYPEPVYFENYKSSGSEKWMQGSAANMESRSSKGESWSRQSQSGGNGSAAGSSNRWTTQVGGSSVTCGTNSSRSGYPSSSLNPYPQDRFESFNRKY